MLPEVTGVLGALPQYSWFIGCFVGFAAYYLFAYRANVANVAGRDVVEAG